jgi:ribose 1,5-bisphosphokinase
MSERLVYTMGPSGAGKDSVLAWLQQRLGSDARLRFARRTINRAVREGDEQHEALDTAAIEALRQTGAFAMDWAANGLHYGIRHNELSALQDGCWVLVNGSRAYLPLALQRYPAMNVLHVTASADTLRRRLLARGRESAEVVAQRVERAERYQPPVDCRVLEIRNEGSLEAAGLAALAALATLPGWPVR